MRFRVLIWAMNPATGLLDFYQSGAGSNAYDAALLGQVREALQSTALSVFVVDTQQNTLTHVPRG